MKSENERYEQWLEALKNNAPVLENPEAMTEDILQKVAFLSQRRNPKRGWKICGWISAAAAGVLLCLLVNDVVFSENEPVLQSLSAIGLQSNQIQMEQEEAPEEWSASMNLMERSRCLSEVWNKRQEKRKKERGALSGKMMEIMNNQSFNK